MESIKDDKKLMRPEEVRRIFSISAVTESNWRKNGKLPEPIKMMRRCYYKASDIEKITG